MNPVRLTGITLLMLTGWFPAQAQTDSATLEYKKWQLEQRKTIQLYIRLEEYEKTAFWSLFDSYCRAIENLEIEYSRIIDLVANHADDLSEEQEEMLANHLVKNDLFLAGIRKLYFKRFTRVFSSAKAIEFMQLDHSLRTVYRLNLQKNNPILTRKMDPVYSNTLQ